MSRMLKNMDEVAYAKALSTALVADMMRARRLDRLVVSKKLRSRQLLDIIHRDLQKEIEGTPGVPLFPNLRALLRTELNLIGLQSAGLSQFDWSSLFSQAVPALAGAVTKYTTAKIEGETAEKLAQLSVQKQTLTLQAADLRARAARAAQAAAAGVAPTGYEPAVGQPGTAGIVAPMPAGTITPRQAAQVGGGIPPALKWGGIALLGLGVGYGIYKVAGG